MSLTYAGVLGLSQRPIGPAIDMVRQAELLGEVLARRAVWSRREPELCRTPEGLPHEPRAAAPAVPSPPGPLESWADRLGPGSLAGALGVLLLTREPRRAADAILAAVPRAARLGRESFAATAARRLARRGVVTLDASAYRRLDRLSAIVVDSDVLCSDWPQILTAEEEGGDLRSLWRDSDDSCAVSRSRRSATVSASETGASAWRRICASSGLPPVRCRSCCATGTGGSAT